MSLMLRKFLISNCNRRLFIFNHKRALSSGGNITSKYSDIEVPQVQLEDYIFAKFDKFPNKIATVSKYNIKFISFII